jgi:hypothetical protein
MADIVLNPGYGDSQVLRRFAEVQSALSFAFDFGSVANVTATLATAAPSGGAFSVDADIMQAKTDMANAYNLSGVQFHQGGKDHIVKASGEVHRDLNPTTGLGTKVGDMTAGEGRIDLTNWVPGSSPAITNFRGVASAPVNGPFTPFGGYEVTFRAAAAPLRSGSLSVLGETRDGTSFNVVANTDGEINSTRVKGRVNYNTGVVTLFAVTPTAPVGTAQVDLSFLGITGVGMVYLDSFKIETLRYGAVAFAYLPLDADILGIDPVRLPSDGRVPIFRPGGTIVVGYKGTTSPATAVNAGTVDTGQERLSRVRVIGNNGATIHTGYSVNLESGIVTWNDVTGYSQPVRVEWRIEDMTQVRDAQINGELSVIPPLTHDYPIGSYISSALIGQDLVARTSLMFDQLSDTGWSDVPGPAATGSYNDTAFPVELTNAGTENQRWMLKFRSTTTVDVIGENLGVLLLGASINADIAPINPVTGEPYFVLREGGWGAGGWSIGNILRFNTIGARFPFWCVRTVQQGPASGEDYEFTLLTRGDVDNPI